MQKKLVPYTSGLGEFIAEQMLSNNLTWGKISKLEGMPSLYQMQLWYDKSKEFREIMDRADCVLARIHIEEVSDTANDCRNMDKDEVSSERLWLEKKKFLIEKLDKNRFGNSSKEGVSHASVNIVMPLDYKEVVDISSIMDENEVRGFSAEGEVIDVKADEKRDHQSDATSN